MREILFRGKRIDNGEWVEGFYCQRKEKILGGIKTRHMILVPDADSYSGARWIDVNPTTVGQCVSGLTDKNGKKIFEGYIIRENYDGAVGVVRFGEYMSPSDYNPTRHIGYFVDWQGKEKDFLRVDIGYWASRSDVEVIGNVHDNPELLEDKL